MLLVSTICTITIWIVVSPFRRLQRDWKIREVIFSVFERSETFLLLRHWPHGSPPSSCDITSSLRWDHTWSPLTLRRKTKSIFRGQTTPVSLSALRFMNPSLKANKKEHMNELRILATYVENGAEGAFVFNDSSKPKPASFSPFLNFQLFIQIYQSSRCFLQFTV